ncbi:MAG: hypothetical protein H7061_01805, partial [Bdellovibrionaceae bacterium]|nr:hypothetical protein [Bdellovibrio sp.]
MNTPQNLSQKNSQRIHHQLVAILFVGFLTACSNSKTNPILTNQPSNMIVLSSDKLLAQCGRSSDTNFTLNTAIARDSAGALAPDWIKIKTAALSQTNLTAGNVIKFFKWRANGATSELDQTPLTFYTYTYSNSQTTSAALTQLATSQINQTTGLYVQLNDNAGVFQVIKAVVYDSTGKVVSQINTLIPVFYAKPTDYQLNADGTPRVALLQQLHPLAATNVTGWSEDQFTQTFNGFCF